MLWMRFSLDGRPGFGTLDNDRIHLHEGDLFDAPVPTGRIVATADVQWLTPCVPGKFICLWNNFHAAALKQSLAIPNEPLWIIKAGSALRAHGQPIVAPAAKVERTAELSKLKSCCIPCSQLSHFAPSRVAGPGHSILESLSPQNPQFRVLSQHRCVVIRC